MPTLPEMAEEFLRDMPSPTDVALGIDNTLRWIWAQSEETLAQTANSLHESFTIVYGQAALPPPPPPPPPPPTAADFFHSVYAKSDRLIRAHPYVVGGGALAVTALGVGWVGLGPQRRAVLFGRVADSRRDLSAGVLQKCRDIKTLKMAAVRPLTRDGHRMEAIVLLGADASPLGFPLAIFLESRGFIVIASVSTKQAANTLERLGHGYIKALVLNADATSTVDPFLASLRGVLSMRFPINIAGDPFASSSTQLPTITSVVSLLALPLPAPSDARASASAATLPSASLQAPLLTPLAIITNLIPSLISPLPASLVPIQLQSKPSAQSSFLSSILEKKVVVFLPAIGNLDGPGLSGRKVQNDSVRAAFKTLSEEIALASKTPFDESEPPAKVRVEIVDLGFVSTVRNELPRGIQGVKQLGLRFFDWARSWIDGERPLSGFDVLERKLWRILTRRASWGNLGVSRVGAGSWTYTVIPRLLPASMMSALLSTTRHHYPDGLPGSSRPNSTSVTATSSTQSSTSTAGPSTTSRSLASLAAGEAAARRQQDQQHQPQQPYRPIAEISSDEEDTDSLPSVPSSMEASGLGESWVRGEEVQP